MAGVDTGAQVSHETIQCVDAILRVDVFKCVLMFLLLAHLVDLHFVVFGVRIVHVVEDEVHGSFDVVIAFAKSSASLFVCQAHLHDRHYAFFVVLKAGLGCRSGGLLDLKRCLTDWVVDIVVEPVHRLIWALLSSVEDCVFGSHFWDSHIDQHVDKFHVELRLLEIFLDRHLMLTSLKTLSSESFEIHRTLGHLQVHFKFFGHPVIVHLSC